MKSNEELNLPESLRYTDEHVWVRMDGGEAVIGISDFAQDQLGEIAFVDLPAVGVRFDAGSDFGTVESLKSVNQLYMPIPGEVVAVNEELESTPTLVNVSPYGEGWMIRIRPDASAESLLDAAGYRALLGPYLSPLSPNWGTAAPVRRETPFLTKPAVPRPEFPGTPSRLKHDRGSLRAVSPVNPHTPKDADNDQPRQPA